MTEYTRYVPFRCSEKQYEQLKKCAAEKKYGDREFSSFLRDSLLEHNGIKSEAVKKSLYQLRWEINKVGTNINQATKRINSGIGTAGDVVELLSNQEQIMTLIEEYIKRVDELWQ